ncbi:hypothetical protein RSAG8_11932, partial [Rhizoctonia solani AG-8 WAC10335]
MTHLSLDNKSKNEPPNTPDPVKVEPIHGRGRFPQESDYDRLASDKIGEELNPKACIWKLYAEEAKEYDAKVNQEQNGNLNNMLLFATLFSVIVTAFVIESTTLLEQDSSEVSTQLLLALVQSQRRIEAGTPNLTLSPAEIPGFVPSETVRLINVLWFASLMISLATAVVALLAKEWLAAFISYQTRDAHKYALERQARLASLDAWNMVPIIDLLPTFLYLALCLFCLGLHIRLWLLDFIVAVAVSCISAMLGLVYLFFMISGAVREDCPYKALLSIYFRRMVQRIVKYFNKGQSTAQDVQKNVETADTQKNIKSAEIEPLTWLFHHSTDPILGNYVTQALAGLRSLGLKLPTFLEDPPIQELRGIYTENSKILASVFELGSQAMDQLRMAPTGGRNELESCGGSSAARLAIAISEIYPYALTWKLYFHQGIQQLEGQPPEETVQSNIWMRRQVTYNNALIIDMPNVCKITEDVFDALDLVWAETSPPLTLSAYAYLLAAELKMARHALAFLGSREEESPMDMSHSSIEMTASSTTNYKLPRLTPGDLRKRSNRALVRTALVIKASVNHVTSKGSQELQSAMVALLLEATRLVEQGKSHLKYILRQFESLPYGKYISVTIVTESNRTRRLACLPQALGHELVEGLVKLCDSGTQDTLLVEGFRVAVFNLLLTFWPACIQCEIMDILDPPDLPPWVTQPWKIVPLQATPYNSQLSAEIIVYESIVLVYIAIGLGACAAFDRFEWDHEKWRKVLPLILRLLMSRSSTLPNIVDKLRSDPRHAMDTNLSCLCYKWLPTNSIIENWIMSIHELCLFRAPGEETSYMLVWCIGCLINTINQLTWIHSGVGIDVFPHLTSTHSAPEGGKAAEHFGLQVDQFMEFIYAASQATGRDVTTTAIGDLLCQGIRFIQTTDCHDCFQCFTQGNGFDILFKTGRTVSDPTAVASTVYDVLVALQATGLLVDPSVLPSLCEAMCYMCDQDMRYQLADSDLFVSSARSQLQLLTHIHRKESDCRTLVYPESERSEARNITSLRDQVQQWVESYISCDGAPSPTSDQARGLITTLVTRSSSGEAPGDSRPDDAANQASSSGQIYRNPPAEVTISSETVNERTTAIEEGDEEQLTDECEKD